MRAASRRVLASDGARPDPGDDVGFCTALLLRQAHFGVEMADLRLHLFSNELAVVADVCCETMRAAPTLRTANPSAVFGIHWCMARPARREFKCAFVQQHGD